MKNYLGSASSALLEAWKAFEPHLRQQAIDACVGSLSAEASVSRVAALLVSCLAVTDGLPPGLVLKLCAEVSRLTNAADPLLAQGHLNAIGTPPVDPSAYVRRAAPSVLRVLLVLLVESRP